MLLTKVTLLVDVLEVQSLVVVIESPEMRRVCQDQKMVPRRHRSCMDVSPSMTQR